MSLFFKDKNPLVMQKKRHAAASKGRYSKQECLQYATMIAISSFGFYAGAGVCDEKEPLWLQLMYRLSAGCMALFFCQTFLVFSWIYQEYTLIKRCDELKKEGEDILVETKGLGQFNDRSMKKLKFKFILKVHDVISYIQTIDLTDEKLQDPLLNWEARLLKMEEVLSKLRVERQQCATIYTEAEWKPLLESWCQYYRTLQTQFPRQAPPLMLASPMN